MPENPSSRRTSVWFRAKKFPTSMLAAERSTTAGFQKAASPFHPWRRMAAAAQLGSHREEGHEGRGRTLVRVRDPEVERDGADLEAEAGGSKEEQRGFS
jgi:hypothetical protein